MSALALDDEQRELRTARARGGRRPAPASSRRAPRAASTGRCSSRWAATACCATSSEATADEPVRDAAAMRLCLLRETIAAVSAEAETALALQGLGSYPILQSGSPETVERWIPRRRRGHDGGGLRAVRARGRLRRSGAVAAGRAGRRRLAAVPARRCGSPTPPRPTSTRCSRAPRRARARAASPRSRWRATRTG